MTIPPPPPGPPALPQPPTPQALPAAADPVARRPRGWWRRNRFALLALAVLVPVTVAGVGWYEWHQYFGYGARPFQPVVAADSDAVELAGAEWGPVRAAEIEDLNGLDVPPKTKIIAAAVPVDPGEDGVYCSAPALVQQSSGREWLPLREEIGLQYNADEPASCSSIETTPYEMILAFVLPEDVEGPFWVDVAPQGADGRFVRFSVDP